MITMIVTMMRVVVVVIVVTMKTPQIGAPVDSTSAFYSEGAGFKFRHGDWLSWRHFFMVLPTCSIK
jgi:hypothetical protein